MLLREFLDISYILFDHLAMIGRKFSKNETHKTCNSDDQKIF